LIGAAATIVAAAITGVLAVNAGAVEVSLTDRQGEIDGLRSTATSLQRENEELTATNAELEDQVAEADEEAERTTDTTAREGEAGGTTPTTSAGSPRTSTVRRETGGTPLAFSYGYGVDLDSQDADWSIGRWGDGWDIALGNGGDLNTFEVVVVDHVPTEAECDDATVRQSSLPGDQFVEGTMMCTTTDEGRYAFVRVTSIDEEAETASFDVTVWE
jgi:hypothetical protein